MTRARRLKKERPQKQNPNPNPRPLAGSNPPHAPANRSHRGAGKLALVFGREVEGLADWEVRLATPRAPFPRDG